MILSLFSKISTNGYIIYIYIIVGLGPGGLDSWNPLMKGMVTCECVPLESQTTNPNQQLTISWNIDVTCSYL